MSSLYIILMFAIPLAIVAAVLALFIRRPRIELFRDGIVVHYPYKATIMSDDIASIRIVDELPKINKNSGNGYKGINRLCGFYQLKQQEEKGSRICLFYLQQLLNGPYIEVAYKSGYCYINLQSEILTRSLYDEMIHTVKLNKKADIQVPKNHKDAPKYFLRSMLFCLVLVFVICCCTILPLGRKTTISFTDNSIKIAGSYKTEIFAKDITSTELVYDYPKMLRLNGIATTNVKQGYFKTPDGVKYSMYLLKTGSKPYVLIETDECNYLLNGFDDYSIDDIYSNIQKLISNYEEGN